MYTLYVSILFEMLFYLDKMHFGGYCLILYLLAFVFTVAYFLSSTSVLDKWFG